MMGILGILGIIGIFKHAILWRASECRDVCLGSVSDSLKAL